MTTSPSNEEYEKKLRDAVAVSLHERNTDAQTIDDWLKLVQTPEVLAAFTHTLSCPKCFRETVGEPEGCVLLMTMARYAMGDRLSKWLERCEADT